jgi:hypothetical protein
VRLDQRAIAALENRAHTCNPENRTSTMSQ